MTDLFNSELGVGISFLAFFVLLIVVGSTIPDIDEIKDETNNVDSAKYNEPITLPIKPDSAYTVFTDIFFPSRYDSKLDPNQIEIRLAFINEDDEYVKQAGEMKVTVYEINNERQEVFYESIDISEDDFYKIRLSSGIITVTEHIITLNQNVAGHYDFIIDFVTPNDLRFHIDDEYYKIWR